MRRAAAVAVAWTPAGIPACRNAAGVHGYWLNRWRQEANDKWPTGASLLASRLAVICRAAPSGVARCPPPYFNVRSVTSSARGRLSLVSTRRRRRRRRRLRCVRARARVCDGVNPRDSLRHNTCPSARPAAAAAALTSYTPAALDTTTTTTTDSDNASVPFHVRAVAVAASTDESLDPHGPPTALAVEATTQLYFSTKCDSRKKTE